MGGIKLNDFSSKEVENTLEKYFSNEEINSINSLIRMYRLEDRPRLVMACIKLTKGNYKELSSYLFHANDYCMEFIAKAEKEDDYQTWVKGAMTPIL
jgi:hypothetical protein